MRSDKLQDAIGLVEESLVIRAAKKPRIAVRWTVPVAACLTIVLCFVFVFSPEKGTVMNDFIVRAAEYPAMASYPGEDYDKYEAWRRDVEKQGEYYNAGEGLQDFYAQTVSKFLTQSDQDNPVYSPVNVYMALAILAEITDGNSRAQILSLLGADSIIALRMQAKGVWNANYRNDGASTSILASSLWMDEDTSFKPATLSTLADIYYASSFKGQAGTAEFNRAMQEWMNDQTGGLLARQIKNIETNPETILALITTLYFRVQWSDEFSVDDTVTQSFYGEKRTVKTDFMRTVVAAGDYYVGDGFSAVRKGLNYGSMDLILPDEGVTVSELLARSQALSFIASGKTATYTTPEIHLAMPKFDVQSQMDLVDALKSLGVTDCFDSTRADFSSLMEQPLEVKVTEIKHGARVAVDEEGVTAAAYTFIAVDNLSAYLSTDVIEFTLDRPFVFVVRGPDKTPLFVGVVNQL